MTPLKDWYSFGPFLWSEVVKVAAYTDDPVQVARLLDTRLRSMLLRNWVTLVLIVIIVSGMLITGLLRLTPAFCVLFAIWMVVAPIGLFHSAQRHWLVSKRHDLTKLATRRYRLSFFLQPAQWWTIHREVDQQELVERVLIIAGQGHLISHRLKA